MAASTPGPDETCREIEERLSNLNRYVTVAIAFLFVATVLILQRIAEDRRETERHQIVKDAAVKQVVAAERRLQALARSFDAAILRAEKSKNVRIRVTPDDEHIFASAFEALQPGSGPNLESAFIANATVRLRDLAATESAYRNAEVLFQRAVAQGYEYVHLRDARDAKLEALRAVSREKSFPSPFGDISLDPEVALAYLAMLAAGSYVLLVVMLRRALALAPNAGGQATVEPPAWLYTADSACRNVVGWRSDDETRVGSAIAIHLCWLALSLGLACATFLNSAHRSIAFLHPAVVVAAIAAANALALLGSMSVFLPPADDELTAAGKVRRSVLGAFVASLAAAPLVVLVRREWLGSTPDPAPAAVAATIPKTLLKNVRSGVIHHGRVCASHLGAAKHLTAAATSEPKSHRGCATAILFAEIADLQARSRGQRDTAVFEVIAARLERAIAAEPMNWALLDKLICVRGRLKQYDKIAERIDRSIAAVKETAARGGNRKTIQRSLAELEYRKARHEMRAAKAKQTGNTKKVTAAET